MITNFAQAVDLAAAIQSRRLLGEILVAVNMPNCGSLKGTCRVSAQE